MSNQIEDKLMNKEVVTRINRTTRNRQTQFEAESYDYSGISTLCLVNRLIETIVLSAVKGSRPHEDYQNNGLTTSKDGQEWMSCASTLGTRP